MNLNIENTISDIPKVFNKLKDIDLAKLKLFIKNGNVQIIFYIVLSVIILLLAILVLIK